MDVQVEPPAGEVDERPQRHDHRDRAHPDGGTEQPADERPTALACARDRVALGVLLAATRLGLRVPQDVAVTGFDDIPLAASVSPALTTVQQDTKQAGQLLVERLLALIGRQAVDGQTIPVKLVVRESSLRG